MRQIGKLPTLYQVDQNGRIRFQRVATGINSGAFYISADKPTRGEVVKSSNPRYKDWCLLEDAYSQDGRKQVREEGFAFWCSFHDEIERKRKVDPKFSQDFPAEWLPELVTQRRKEHLASKTAKIAVPEIQKPAPKKRRSKVDFENA